MKVIDIKVKDLAKLFLVYGEQLTKPSRRTKNTDVIINIKDYDESMDVKLHFLGDGNISIVKEDKCGNTINSQL